MQYLFTLNGERTQLYRRIISGWLTGVGNPLRLWRQDEPFIALMRELRGRTLVDRVRCYMLYQHARQAAALAQGDAAEIGVYRGGTARLLARTLARTPKAVHLFDTFTGMPPSDPAKDFFKDGDLTDTSLADVQAYLRDCPNVRFYPGRFPATAASVAARTFCLVHVDVDLYQSVLDCCRFFYPRLVPGGVMIFDDYGFLSCPGGKQAVDEFFAATRERPCYLPTGQCIVTRL